MRRHAIAAIPGDGIGREVTPAALDVLEAAGRAHGIADQGIANPIGAIWSGAQMLEHLGEEEAAAAVLAAIEEMLANDGPRTRDLGGTATTADVTAALTGMFASR